MTDLHEQRHRAVAARDARFDGVFFTAVRTTGIYCRPSCPAVTPRIENVEFHITAAAAQEAGYRACRRCRPDTVPGSPEWDVRADVVGRAMRLIGDGVVEREGVTGLAGRLGYSTRHLTRLLADELGAGPLALARSARTQTARLLVETTTMPMADVAFAAGFSSVRQFNDSMRAAYGMTPRELRSRGRHAPQATGTLSLRLAVRRPFAAGPLLEFLADHVVPGMETVEGRTYVRTARLPHGHGVLALTLHDDHVRCDLELDDLRDTAVAVGRARRLLDLDADPVAIDSVLGADPGLAPHVAAEPGLRVPGSMDGFETAARTIVGQQVSLAGAATVLGRLVAAHGAEVDLPLARRHGLERAFPAPEVVAKVPAESLAMPRSRARALAALGQAVDAGDVVLDPGADRDAARASLLALPGVGLWTADYVLMRALSHPDVLLTTDLVLHRELERRGLGPEHTDRWRPWRSYAGMHLWRAATSSAPEEEPTMTTRWMDSPIGGLRLHARAGLLAAIDFDAEPRGTRVADPVLDEAERQLGQYFAGERRDFDLPLASEGTAWQQKVWGELRRIPFGETASYGEIARRLGYEPVVSRAVGAANGRNPIPIVVPCHRVIGADGTLTGYAGGLERKRVLLALERPGLF